MLEWITLDRSYNPETIAAMTSAFDRVCRSLSSRVSGNEDVRRKLASIILQHADRGERDPVRLSDLELMGP
jgi:hypothetical protein